MINFLPTSIRLLPSGITQEVLDAFSFQHDEFKMQNDF